MTKTNGMYYRADNEEAVEAYCHACAPSDYSAWEDIRCADNEICVACGSQITTNI